MSYAPMRRVRSVVFILVMDVDLRLLRYARALADHESFSVAARVLHISQPALSRAIQRLEKSAGSRLFDRTSAGVFPTDSGELLLARAEDLLAGAESLRRELSRVRAEEERPSLAMGAGPFTAQLLAGDAIARILRAMPGTSVQLRIDQFPELARMVRGREVDLALAEASTVAEKPDLEVIPLEPVQGRFAVRAGHPLAGRGRLSMEEILAFPLVFTGRLPPRILEPLVAAATRIGEGGDGPAPAVPAVDAPSLSVIVDVVAGSDAVGPVTPTIARPAVEAGRLVLLDAELPWLRTAFAILLPRERRPSGVLDRAVEAAREAGAAWADREREAERALVGR